MSPTKKQVYFAEDPSVSISNDSPTPAKKRPAQARGRVKFQKSRTLAPSKAVSNHDTQSKGTKYHKAI